MNEDEFIRVITNYDNDKEVLVLTLKAKSNITITELQGYTQMLKQFEATMPKIFKKVLFGEGVEIPPEMEIEMKVMNETQFRWGTELSIPSGQTKVIEIPAKASSNEANILTLAYKHPKLFGLLKGSNAIYIRLGQQ